MKEMKLNFQKCVEGNQNLSRFRVMAAYKKSKNLKDYLVKAKVKTTGAPKQKPINKIFKQKKWVQNLITKQVFPADPSGHIYTKNCVYLITCTTCGSQFVGETRTALITKLCQQKFKSQTPGLANTEITNHFSIHGVSAMSATVLKSNTSWTEQQRKTEETNWLSNLSLQAG